MDKVFIKDLRVTGILGIHDWERVTPREIVINVTLFTDTRAAAQSDDIADCVDYSATAKKIRAHAESAARMTVEALANDLAEICLQDPKVQKAIVRVEKPGAVPDSASVGVEIERARMTVEALANDLAEICLQDPKVQKVIVRVEKPGAVPDSASLGVEIERARQAGE